MASPSDRKYGRKHEWCKLEGETSTVGVTDYAQKQLTDIVFVELPKVGAKVEQGKRNHVLSNEAKRKALAIKEFIADMGPENLSEKFRERYK